MNTDLNELLRMMRREIWQKRRLFAAVYLATSLVILVVGWNWPKMYTSSSTVLVDQQSILEPLMQGTAVTTDISGRGEVAREIMFSREVIDQVLEKSGWSDGELTDLERDRLIARIEGNTEVEVAGQNVIRISYADQDPERAYRTASELTDVFINRSLRDKRGESRAAYMFINGQVLEYERKLKEAEAALKEFNGENMDARPGSQESVNERIADLKQRKEATNMAIRELEIERETLERQLRGQSVAGTDSDNGAGQLRERLWELQQELDTLRLSYHDTYPDIVQLKGQIASVERALAEHEQTGNGSVVGRASADLYDSLRGRYSETETRLATLNERLRETSRMLSEEEERLARIDQVEAQLAALTRDYQVNQEIYQSLLRQRENARISMSIDEENQGRTFQVQEPAALPRTPEGVRFSHFMAAGLVASFAFPLALIYGLTLLDQRVRTRNVITESIGLPVLASVYHPNRPIEYDSTSFRKSIILLVIVVSWLVYGYAAWLKVMGEL